MRKILSLSALTILFLVGAVFCQEVLTNEDVITMHEAGLPASVIVAKVNSSQTSFDTSVEALVSLANQGIPDEVITAMTEAGSTSRQATSSSQSSQTAPVQQIVHGGRITTGQLATKQANVATNFAQTPCPGPGIFLKVEDGVEPIEASAYTGAKAAGLMKSALTYGILSSKTKAMINGMRSHNVVRDRSPEFYFCFEETQTGLSYETSGATTPGQFLLVEMDVNAKQNARLIVTGKVNAYTGGYAGPPPKYRREFAYEKLAPGVYEVSINGLPPGEYCFFYTGSASASAANTLGLVAPSGGGKVFDFSIG